MRAERDDDEVRIVRKTPERRLAYEIAIGIIIGGSALSFVQQVGDFILAKIILHQVQIALPFLHG